MLEVLEERTLPSASTGEVLVQPALMELEKYAVQESANYITRYDSTVLAVRSMAENLRQQALLAVYRIESTVLQMVERLEQPILFSAPTETPIRQSSSLNPGQSEGQKSNHADLNDFSAYEPTATPIGKVVPVGQASPAGGPGQPNGFSPSQISQAYGFNQVTFNNGAIKGDGSGQTIAIVGAYNQPNIASDLQTFDSMYGIASPPSFTIVNQTGGTTLPADDGGWGQEETVDVEWAHAIAPGASIVLVEANSSNWSDLMPAVNYARNLAGVSVVSMSWGGAEFSDESSQYDSNFTTPSGHNGVTFVAASGDSGSSGNEPEFPSISPNVLAVGGTVLTTDSAGDYESESGWYLSGGGLSAYEPQPSYQKGVVTQSNTQRAVPDVALNAYGFAFYDTFGDGGWAAEGGTSFATPIWAALIAIADQGRVLNGEGTLDGPSQTLPAIYQMPQSNFHDITTGNNGYAAGPGYDLVTGRGTPIANLVVNSLVSYDSSYWQRVDLSSYYNRNGFTYGGTPITGGGLDGNNDDLAPPTNFSWDGTSLSYGPINALDVVSANQGQTINLPAGNYSTLTLFADAVNGDQTDKSFTVVYSNGTQQTFTRSLTNWLSAPGYSDELRVEELTGINPDGSKMSQPAYDSAYSLPLNPTLTIKSIILPNDSNIEILGMALYHDGATGQQVSLSSAYNRNGFTYGGTPITGGGLDGNNDDLAPPTKFSWDGASLSYGPINALDVVSANQGQTINLPAGNYSTLTLFADAVNGNQTDKSFTVVYSNGNQQTFTRSLTNWLSSPGYSDELRVEELTGINPDGSKMSQPAYDSAYALPLNPTLTIKSIILPNDSNIEILGMLLS